jgi:DnaJ-class molecular chaperone
MSEAKWISLVLLVISFIRLFAQTGDGEVVFWTSSEWECSSILVDLYDVDSNLIFSGRLDKTYKGYEIPNCGHEQTLTLTDITTGNYFFVADCSVEQCYVCGGEGSYWQPVVQSETPSTRKSRNQGNIEGTWRTCYVCQGNGQASTILWLDTLSVKENACRSVLLK